MTNLAVSNVRNRPLGKASSLADLGLRKAKPDQLGNKVSRIHAGYYKPADIQVNRVSDKFSAEISDCLLTFLSERL